MKENTLNEEFDNILSSIYKKQLLTALAGLQMLLEEIRDWELTNRFEHIRTSYLLMLHYMRKHTADPERKKLYTKLLAETWELADQARIRLMQPFSNKYYFTTRNYLQSISAKSIKTQMMEMESFAEEIAMTELAPESTANAGELRNRHENAQSTLFFIVWTNSAWKAEDENQANEMIQSVLIPRYDRCLLVSAVTMSMMECFDVRKILWLFDASQHEDVAISQRALVGLAFAFQIYYKRMELYPEITARISLLDENGQFGKDLSRVHIQMLMCQETEKIDKKMREEIIPEMLKSTNLRNMKFDFDETDEEGNDHNPDWTKAFENSPLSDKLREMTELQMEGADVYMSTFSALKNSYPFFKTLSNWFYPFDPGHSSAVKVLKDRKQDIILNLILNSGAFCDSDKYSLCFTIMQIPQMQRDMMLSQLSEQQLEQLKSEKDKTAEQVSFVSNQYLHNLYRFFKLYPRRQEFRDIFKESIRLNDYPLLQPVLRKAEYLQNLAEYYFRKGLNTEAANIYHSIIELSRGNADVYQKLGYCLQKEKKYDDAIEAYLKSDMIKPDNIWTNRHLATCYRMNRSFEKALEYYYKVNDIQSENKNVLFNIGSCLAELGRYEEALNYFFKLDFLDTENLKTWRAIGWCSFASGKLVQAMKYYEKVLEKQQTAPDCMNAGHVAWCDGKMEKAIAYYTHSIELFQGKSKFLDMFYRDTLTLIKQGILEEDIPLMLDLL